jgi:hypothetical protein
MLRSSFSKTLWDLRRTLLGWAIGITAVGAASAYKVATNDQSSTDFHLRGRCLLHDVVESWKQGGSQSARGRCVAIAATLSG